MLKNWLAQNAFALGMRSVGFALKMLLLVWALAAAWFLFFGDHPPHHGFGTRLFTSTFIDAPSAIPSLIAWGLARAVDMLTWGHSEVARDLGYSPFDVAGLGLGGSMEGFLASVIALTVKAAAIQAAGVLAMTSIGMRHDFSSPGTIWFMETFDRWLYLALIYGVGAWTAVSAFDAGLMHGLAGTLAGLIVITFRILPLFPLYVFAGLREKFGPAFAEEVGARYGRSSNEPGGSSHTSYKTRRTGAGRHRSYRSTGSTNGRAKTRAHDAEAGARSRARDAGSSAHDEKTSAKDKERGAAHHPIASDCRLFGLQPDTFDYATLKKEFRVFMKKHHSRQAGDSDEMSKRGNAALSSIRKHYGWA